MLTALHSEKKNQEAKEGGTDFKEVEKNAFINK